jgi:hypothetical protein
MKQLTQTRQVGMFEESCEDLPLFSGTPRTHPAPRLTSAPPRPSAHTASYLDDGEGAFKVVIRRGGQIHPLGGTYPTFAAAWDKAEELRQRNPRTEYLVQEIEGEPES